MSLAALAAAATVYDDIERVAQDVRMSVPAARATIEAHGIASVGGDGRVSMSVAQSQVAAQALGGEDRFGW